MSALDFVVLIGSMVSIAAYGVWHTRGNLQLFSSRFFGGLTFAARSYGNSTLLR
jgi:hypothetical protein